MLTENNPATGSLAVLAITTPGGVSSFSIENWLAAVLVLPAASWATPLATSMVTVPSAAGVMSAVNTVLSEVARLEAAPLPTVISPTANPLTASEKVTVTENTPETGSAALEVIVAVGRVWSFTIVN